MLIEIFAVQEGQKRLLEKLDKSLLNHAKNLTAGDGPRIVDVYGLQELAEVHCYLKAVHQFAPAEVEALLQFADPLEAADLCWQENPHEYCQRQFEIVRKRRRNFVVFRRGG